MNDIVNEPEGVDSEFDGQPLAEAVISGTVVDVSRGRAFRDSNETGGSSETDFDQSASWATYHLLVKVDDVLAGESDSEIMVGLVLTPDQSLDGLRSTFVDKQFVFFLNRPTAVFSYDPSVHATVNDGELIAPVSDKGLLSLPALPEDEAAEMLAGSPTLEALERAAIPR